MKRIRCPAERGRRRFRLILLRYIGWIVLFYLLVILAAAYREY